MYRTVVCVSTAQNSFDISRLHKLLILEHGSRVVAMYVCRHCCVLLLCALTTYMYTTAVRSNYSYKSMKWKLILDLSRIILYYMLNGVVTCMYFCIHTHIVVLAVHLHLHMYKEVLYYTVSSFILTYTIIIILLFYILSDQVSTRLRQ